MSYKHLKHQCAGCERTNVEMNQEHVYPEWLIRHTGTNKTSIRRVGGNKVNPLSATLPLCVECNKVFGKELEIPVSKIFNDLESKKGISENEAELLIRWLWKIDGLFWIAFNPKGNYSHTYTLRQRVLQPLDSIRSKLLLAVALINNIDPTFGDKPLGIDSHCTSDAIFVAGVFSQVALMVVYESFKDMIPSSYSTLKLKNSPDSLSNGKFFYPKVGFKDDVEAVGVSGLASKELSIAHDLFAKKLRNLSGAS